MPKEHNKLYCNCTDAKQSIAKDTVKVNVINVQCGNRKVIICHKGQTLCVPEQAVASHLRHGDKLGLCPFKFGCHINNSYVIQNDPGLLHYSFASAINYVARCSFH